VPGPYDHPSRCGELVDVQRYRRRQGEHAGTTSGANATLDRLEYRLDQPVLGTGRELKLEFDLPFDAADPAKEGAGRSSPELVTAIVATDGQRIDDGGHPSWRVKRRLEEHGVLEVRTARLKIARGSYGPVASSGVEEACKRRWPVEAWETQPVDRTARAHQGRRTAVGQEGIVTDRKIMSFHAPNFSVRCCATRRALAMMVNVGFTDELEQKKLESTT
jgi:hypothetical protein